MSTPKLAGGTTDAYAVEDWITGSEAIVTDFVVIPADSGDIEARTVLGVVSADGTAIPSLSAASDGSEDASAILVHAVADSTEAQRAPVYVAGTFNPDLLVFGTGHDADSVKQSLRSNGIHLKIPYNDPLPDLPA